MKRIFPALIMVAFACGQNSRQEKAPAFHMDRHAIADKIETSLRAETLEKWYPMSVDTVFGGFLSTYTHDWKPEGNQEKMIVTQARHTWVNAKASLLYPDLEHYRKSSAIGFQFLRDKMWDQKYGGFYWLVSRKGDVVDDAKTAYGNAFGIYALAAYYEASKDTTALALAKQAFRWLEEHSHDSVYGGYYQHMKRNGEMIIRGSSVDSKAETGYKDQNSSIHLLEAFTELYHVWPDALLRQRLEEMLKLIRDTIVTEKGYMVLFFTPDWKPVSFFDSSRAVIESHHSLDHVSFGHDIETAYLLIEASEALGRDNDSKTLAVSKRMVDHALDKGYDKALGGFYDEGYYFKGEDEITITRDTKNWWAQAEGMNTLLIFADLYPDDSHQYAEKFVQQWNYIDQYLIDHEFGDWYAGGLDKEPEQKTALKGHIWKATYHHFRSMVNCIRRLRHSEGGNGHT
jgi:cellobiose epimerase